MSATVKERPIIFSGPMVRAILAGKKTQTRRVMKRQPESSPAMFDPSGGRLDSSLADLPCWAIWPAPQADKDGSHADHGCKFPYGRVGDRLWVKETWSPDHAAFYPNFPTVFRANGEMEIEGGKVFSPEVKAWHPFRWRSPIHLPRRLSRLTLEIAGVKAERLNDISEEDAKAEGVVPSVEPPAIRALRQAAGAKWVYAGHLTEYRHLWETIHGADSWDANPWVWAIAFRVVPPGNPPGTMT